MAKLKNKRTMAELNRLSFLRLRCKQWVEAPHINQSDKQVAEVLKEYMEGRDPFAGIDKERHVPPADSQAAKLLLGLMEYTAQKEKMDAMAEEFGFNNTGDIYDMIARNFAHHANVDISDKTKKEIALEIVDACRRTILLEMWGYIEYESPQAKWQAIQAKVQAK